MHGYKVTFNNNVPENAVRLDFIDNKNILKINTNGGRRYMEWLVVCGNNEHDAIYVAYKLVQTIWASYLV